jgi:glyoxylase-like metal-dependent hydrolase (beta-lactamase superfamily II)/ferredoxin
MARESRRLHHNAPGEFFVDSSCIDCDTCRWMAPQTFVEREGQASVRAQPTDDAIRLRAEMALISCPTGSIGTMSKLDLTDALGALPDGIDGNVYHCGYHSESSFGAASYLIVRPEGNVLIDSPRFTRPLVKRIEELGGVRTLFLTHKDDVADHRKFREHFECDRVLHRRDIGTRTRDVEIPLEGEDAIPLDESLTVIPTPGHTAGSCCLLYDEKFLFTGDHLAWSESRGHIYAFRGACWYDWRQVVASSEKLLSYQFEWILPGHGRRCHFERERMPSEMARAVEWMRAA